MSKASQELNIPNIGIKNWTVFGVDLSLSRTGHARLDIRDGVASWVSAGSIKPKDASKETWARGRAIALTLHSMFQDLQDEIRANQTQGPYGVIVSMEFPDPENSYLMALNGIVQGQLWGVERPWNVQVFRLSVNASTLRSVLRLGTKGKGTDKAENLAMAYEYADREVFPRLDTDSCDAVLLAMLGLHTAMALSGHEDRVPAKPLTRTFTTEMKRKEFKRNGVVTRVELTPVGLVHNPATWTVMPQSQTVDMAIYDASKPKVGSVSSTVLT